MLRDSPEAGAAGPSPAPPALSPCRTVTHRLSPGHSLPQSGQICLPAPPPPPAVWRKHRGTASQTQESRDNPPQTIMVSLSPCRAPLTPQSEASEARTVL